MPMFDMLTFITGKKGLSTKNQSDLFKISDLVLQDYKIFKWGGSASHRYLLCMVTLTSETEVTSGLLGGLFGARLH